MADLESQGLLENTIIIWTSDHGDGLPRAKRSLYDTGIKVPMIIRWPARYRPAHLEPGQLDNRMISFVDLMPTILDMARVNVPQYAVGHNFLTAKPQRDAVFASQDRIGAVYDRQRAMRDKRYKYIRSWYPQQPLGYRDDFRINQNMMRELLSLHETGKLNEAQELWFKPPGEEQLYDTLNDPFELNNLAADSRYRAIKLQMSKTLEEWLQQTGDWSEQHEIDMVEGFLKNGKSKVTEVPEIDVLGNTITIACATNEASIGYRLDDGAWQLYSGPFTTDADVTVTAKAVRYGWDESEETTRVTK
jgi:N-sulfoglucosamine sulfohydrolase